MPKIHLSTITSRLSHGAATVGRVGTWPVRKAGAKMRTAPSGAARAANAFRSKARGRYDNWAETRNIRQQQKTAAQAEGLLKSLTPKAAATALFEGLLADKVDFGLTSGAIAALNGLRSDDAAKALTKAVGDLTTEQREKLWTFDFGMIDGKVQELRPPSGDKTDAANKLTTAAVKDAIFEWELKATQKQLSDGDASAQLVALVHDKPLAAAVAAKALEGFAIEQDIEPLVRKAVENLRDFGQEKLWNIDFKGVGCGKKTQAALEKALFECHRGKFKECAPLLTIGDGGNVSGSLDDPRVHSCVQFPGAADGNVTARTPARLIEARSNERLKESEISVVDGQALVQEGRADFHRMNINLELGGGTTYSTRGAGSEEKLSDTVTNLRKLAKGQTDEETAATTKVLSSILNQHDIRDLARGFAHGQGRELTFLPVPSGHQDVRVYDDKGGYERHTSQQIGSAEITVSKQGDDFRVSVEWPYLANRILDGSKTLSVYPLNPTSTPTTAEEKATPVVALKVTLSGSFLVSGKDAANGTVNITQSNFKQTVSGALQPPSLAAPKAAVGGSL